MAIQTRRIAGDGSPEKGYVEFWISWDDVGLFLTELKCINNSSEATWGKAINIQTGRSYERTFPANETTILSLPGQSQNRLNITIDARGRVDGCDYFFMWPAPV